MLRSIIALASSAFLLLGGCRRQVAATPEYPQKFASVADARAHLPPNCAALYFLNGIPQPDTSTVYAVSRDRLVTVQLATGTSRGPCPVIWVEAH